MKRENIKTDAVKPRATKIIATIVALAIMAGAMLTLVGCGDDSDSDRDINVDFGSFENLNGSENDDDKQSGEDKEDNDKDDSGADNNDDTADNNATSDEKDYGSLPVAKVESMNYLDVMGKTRDEIFALYGETRSYKYSEVLDGIAYQMRYEFEDGRYLEIFFDEAITAKYIAGKFPISGALGLPEFMDVSISYGYEYYMKSNRSITKYEPLDYYSRFTFYTAEYTFTGEIDSYEGECWFTSITAGGFSEDPIRTVLKRSPLCDPNSLYVHTFADITHDGIDDMISVYGVSDKGCVVVTDGSSGEPVEIYRDEMKLNFNGEKVAGDAFDYLLYYEKGLAYLFKTGFIDVPLPEGDYYIFHVNASGEVITRTNGLYGNKDKHSHGSWLYAVATEGEYRENAKELLTSMMGLTYFTSQISDKDIAELKNK